MGLQDNTSVEAATQATAKYRPIDSEVSTSDATADVLIHTVDLSAFGADQNIAIEVMFQAVKAAATEEVATYRRLFTVLTTSGPGLTLKDSGDLYTFEEGALSGCDVGATVSGTDLLLEVTGIAAVALQWRVTGYVVNVDGCFVSGTFIHTPDGLIAVDDLEVGDKVLTMNTNRMALVESEVLKIHEHQDHEVLILVAGDENIVATPEHPFYLPDQGEYLRLGSLEVGYNLRAKNGDLVPVQSIIPMPQRETVYNITVEGEHNFFVGPQGILVHNK